MTFSLSGLPNNSLSATPAIRGVIVMVTRPAFTVNGCEEDTACNGRAYLIVVMCIVNPVFSSVVHLFENQNDVWRFFKIRLLMCSAN